MAQYANIWSAPGLLGAPPRMHSSRTYDTVADAIAGHGVPPGPERWTLMGTLQIDAPHQPRFVPYVTLVERSRAEAMVAA